MEGRLVPAIPYLKDISSEYRIVNWKCFQHVNISSNCNLTLIAPIKNSAINLSTPLKVKNTFFGSLATVKVYSSSLIFNSFTLM